MSNHIVVNARGTRIFRFTVIFSLALLAFVLCVDLLALKLSGGDFLSAGNAKFVLCLTGVILACSLFQFHRLSGSGSRVAEAMGATRVGMQPRKQALKTYRNIATEVAIAAGIQVPALYVLKSDRSINAFAAGDAQKGMAVCVTSGALDQLTRDELQGVVAHEMAHLRHGDVAISRLFAASIFGLFCFAAVGGLIAWMAGRAARSASKEGVGAAAALMIGGLVIVVVGAVGWLVASMLDAATSREMEYRADADAVRMMSNSDGLVGALTKIGQESRTFPDSARGWMDACNPMFFGNGVKRYWFDTHPPLLDRIQALDPAKAAALRYEMGE